MLKVKIIVCFVWMFCTAALFSFQTFLPATAQTKETMLGKKVKFNLKPENALVDRFDNAIQQRFLTEPYFGIRRIQPVYPPNPHLEQFSPINDEEKASVAGFEKEGWKVGLYLFGRRATPKIVDGKEQKEFSINYRLNKPLPITRELNEKQLPKAEKLLKEVKAAFLDFQTPNSPNENEYEFSIGKWSYVAKPVRAVNQSCLKCHTDYVMTEKIGDGKYKFRKRQVGDANGVVVYGFVKND
ncbi:MAG: c-type heme family protein [Pyrinomonadaceae bacterium]